MCYRFVNDLSFAERINSFWVLKLISILDY